MVLSWAHLLFSFFHEFGGREGFGSEHESRGRLQSTRPLLPLPACGISQLNGGGNASERNCIADDPLGDGAHNPDNLTSQIVHRDSQVKRGHDSKRTKLDDEESNRSGDQSDGGPVWLDGAGCRKGYSGPEGVDAGDLGTESFRDIRAEARQPVTSGYASHHRDAIVFATGRSMKDECPNYRS